MASEPRPRELSRRSFTALKWNYAGNALRAGAQLIVGIVLARLLGPDAFGTVAIAWLMIGVGTLVADLGFGAAIVQREELAEGDIRYVFTLQVCLGAVLSLAGIVLGGAIASFFHRSDAAPIVRAMASLFFIQAFGQTALALLRRALDFRAAQLIGIASYLLGYGGVGIPLAVLGYGAWSLVAAQLVQAASSSILAIHRSRASVRPTLVAGSRGILSFGSKVIGANLTSWAMVNVDSLAVGRLLGVLELGVYNRAMALVATPTGSLTAGLQGVLFAACSRAQAERGRIARAYLGATAAISVIAMPIFFTVAAVPGTVVAGVYGGRWAAATPVLVPLALAMPVTAVLGVVGPVLTAIGRVGVELRVQVIALAVAVPLLAVAARHSLGAVAWAVLLVCLARWYLLVSAVTGVLEVSWREVLGALSWPAGFALAAALGTAGIDYAMRFTAAPLRLGGDVVMAAAIVSAAARLFGRRFLSGPVGAFLVAEGRLPGPLRRWLRV